MKAGARTLYSLPSADAGTRVNTWDKTIKVRNKGGWDDIVPNPNYQASERQSRATPQAIVKGEVIKTPALKDRIVACLRSHAAVNEDSLAVVTDMPTDKVRGIIVPDESQNTPRSGVVILCGKESLEKGPPGLACGKRVTWNMMAGTAFAFDKHWEMRVLRYSEVKTVLCDKSGVRAYKQAMKEIRK